jgi:DNA-binding NarL/FixJ family response regulator
MLVEDRDIIIDSLKLYLNSEKGLEISHIAKDGNEAENLLSKYENEIDVVLMDINLPQKDGISLTREFMSKYPTLKILGFSFHENTFYIKEMIKAGAKGYLTKDVPKEEYINAIKCIAKGSVYFTPKVAGLLLKDYVNFLTATY